MGVSELGGDLDLPDEPLSPQARSQLRAQHLDGDFAGMLQIMGQIDRGHTTAADFAFDAVTIDKRLSKTFLVFHPR